ncbi:MAG: hypothetical protein QXX38_03070 [Candidatus Aenigmatarchaeota archaeon]
MPIEYPKGPPPAGEGLKPGEGINNIPDEAQEYLDFTTAPGKSTGMFYGIVFQLPKWGFDRFKIEESIEVSPVFQQYYQLTIQQKTTLESQIKAGLAQITSLMGDLELAAHDMRKYKEFIDYYAMIDKGKEMVKKGKKEEGEKLEMQGEQSLKAVFIDQVDVHTGEGIALKLIAPRWPTIIADFMKLTDNDIDPKKIAEKYKVSEAEGVVLATKNKLYIEWRDRLFRKTVEERFKNLVALVEARKKSVEEYRNMLRPVIARYKAINEMLSQPTSLQKVSFWRPDAQAISMDYELLWAWKPFAPVEKYKVTREVPLDKIPAAAAGFTPEQIEEIKKEKEGWDGFVKALPVEPSIDDVVKRTIKKIESHYGIKITGKDLYDARQMLVEKFEQSSKGLGDFETWVFSPYFIFLEIPIYRTVIRLPNGEEMEDLNIPKLTSAIQTQNLIILHYLELIARDKQLDNYIHQMLGEMGIKGETIEELMKKEIFKTEEEIKEEERKKFEIKKSKEVISTMKKFRTGIGKLFSLFGAEVSFLRAEGPYEFAFQDRLSKMYFKEVASNFAMVRDFFKSGFGAP